ncbi:MAG: methyltransferase domain-containing protein [Candidatus Eisenbacteria bacterium]|nr:methyltransferase domain-containing protein [Candidatus Eisenbacteria bacterium]
MNVRQILRRSQTIVGLARDARSLTSVPRRLSQLRARQSLIDAYLRSHPVRKLHLGAGPALLEGWLNTDLAPASACVAYLDVTKPFPLADASFDYVFSEHMIEHIRWPEGRFMLSECRRVLRPGGTLRVATPDLEMFVHLYGHQDDPRGMRYVRWVTDRYLDGQQPCRPSLVINNLFRSWGHQFLYDGDLLAMTLGEAGFARIRRACPGVSEHEALRGIESHGRLVGDEDMGAFETLVFEASRPA